MTFKKRGGGLILLYGKLRYVVSGPTRWPFNLVIVCPSCLEETWGIQKLAANYFTNMIVENCVMIGRWASVL